MDLRCLTLVLLFLQFSFAANAVIYGNDDRQDIYQVPWLKSVARSVAVAIPNIFLLHEADGTYTVSDTESLTRSGAFVCPDERFAQQPSMGVCTGFLIGDRYLLTAGHCLLPNGILDNTVHPFCQGFSWYFDYNMKTSKDFPDHAIPASRVYGCKRVIRAENVDQGPGVINNDFAVIELDRPVSSDLQPLRWTNRKTVVGDWVYTIGHPTGLPAKFSGKSPVVKSDHPVYFAVNLDTEGGNSGGPVLNVKNEVVGILVSGPQFDYFTDPKQCMRPNRCNQDGTHCVQDSDLQRSNFVQRIQAVLPYIPTSELMM